MQVSPMMRFWGPAMPQLVCTRLPTTAPACAYRFDTPFLKYFRGAAPLSTRASTLSDKTLCSQCLRAWRLWGLPKVVRQDLTNRCVVGVVAAELFIRVSSLVFPFLARVLSLVAGLSEDIVAAPSAWRTLRSGRGSSAPQPRVLALRVFYRGVIAATCSLAPLRALATPTSAAHSRRTTVHLRRR